METRYNLRGRKVCHIPVQVQLVSDAEFMAASRESLDPQHSGQVLSGQSDSGSDIDISGLLDISNQNLSFSDSDSVNHGTAVGGNGGPKASGSNPAHVDQNMINHKYWPVECFGKESEQYREEQSSKHWQKDKYFQN